MGWETVLTKMKDLFIPPFLRDYALDQCEKWADMMVDSVNVVKENIHYAIRTVDNVRQIVHVDFDNKGILRPEMHMGGGLHECLELKESLKMRSPSLITCYSTTLSYLGRLVFRNMKI